VICSGSVVMISAGNNCVMVDTTAFMKRLPANVNAPMM